MGKTAIVILEYNNAEDTLNCVQSVLHYNTASIKFIIVDNASTDTTIVQNIHKGLTTLFPRQSTSDFEYNKNCIILPDAFIVKAKENKGYACGNNLGIEIAYKDPEIEHIMILNSDILFVEDIIPQLIDDLKYNPDAAIVSPVLYKKGLTEIDRNCARRELSVNELIKIHIPFPNDPFGIAAKKRLPISLNSGLMPIDLPSGSCMLARKELFRKIDSFDPNTFLYYEEDILWQKIKLLGLKNYLDTTLKCIHLGATSTKKSSSRFIVNTSVKSAKYLLFNYYNTSWLQRLIMSFFSILIDKRMLIVQLLNKLQNQLRSKNSLL